MGQAMIFLRGKVSPSVEKVADRQIWGQDQFLSRAPFSFSVEKAADRRVWG